MKQEINEKGQKVQIPRPVYALRKWDAKNKKYESVNPYLEGAPSDENKTNEWKKMMDEVISMHGKDEIDKLMSGK